MADRKTPSRARQERPVAEKSENPGASYGVGDAEALRNRVTLAEQQRDEYLDLLKRTRADFENYQKRIQRQLAEERRHGIAGLARELFPVVDNLQRAVDAGRPGADNNPMVQGVALVWSQLREIFSRFGITPLEGLGEPFDPHLQESVSQEFRTDMASGTVVAVLEPGYRLDDRVLRPAKVVVSAAPASESAQAGHAEGGTQPDSAT